MSDAAGTSEEVLLSATPEWQDVTPLPLPEEARAAVDIAFSDEHLDVFGLLYACLQAGERSGRVLKLTETCIGLCSSHYTAWDYRFQARCSRLVY
jgi:hypothetical protein